MSMGHFLHQQINPALKLKVPLGKELTQELLLLLLRAHQKKFQIGDSPVTKEMDVSGISDVFLSFLNITFQKK